MKKIKNIFIIVIIVLVNIALPLSGISQPPPPPGGGGTGSHGSGGNTPGGSAPIGGGLFILLGMGAVYAGKKVYDLTKIDLEE